MGAMSEANADRPSASESGGDGVRGRSPRVEPRESIDPVRIRRAKVARWTLIANRVGYLLFALAIAVFVMAFAFSFNGTMVAIITTCMIAGSILLAPALVLGYGVKAAERDDRENGL